VHIGVEPGADRFNNLCASAVVRLFKDQADRTKPGKITDQLLLGQAARNIDRLDIDLSPAALLQDGRDPSPVREGELPRCIWSAGGEVRQKRSAARSAVVMNWFSAALRQTMSLSSALSLAARRRLAKARTESLKNITPKRDIIMSKLAGSKA
jgi:hypothetical protein